MKIKKISALLLALFCTLMLITACHSKENEAVVIFSSMEDYRNEDLSRKLKEIFPEIPVTIQQISTGNNAAKIKAEGASTEADIVLGLETAYMIQLADFFASLEEYPQSQYLDGVNKDSRFFTWELYEGAFIVNTQVLEQRGLEEPKNYQDLLKPEYQNLIVMSNPKTSGTGYMFLNSWVNLWGEDEAFAYVDKLQNNIMQFTESGAGPVKTLVQGEAAIGLGMIFQAAKQITDGSPLKIIVPEEGCPYNTTSFSIVKGKETKSNVQTIFNYFNNEYSIYDKENFAPGRIFKEQKSNIANYPEKIKSADMSTIADTELKNELLAKWKY